MFYISRPCRREKLIRSYLDIQHKMWEISLDDRLHMAPIGPAPHRVLDIATGSGVWGIDFGNYYRVTCWGQARVARLANADNFQLWHIRRQW